MEEKEFLNKLGHKIKVLRMNKKVSQDKLAELGNIERAHISNIENGKTNPSILYLKQIADGLGVDIADLFKFVL